MLSVVVPACNVALELPDQLAALADQESPVAWEVVVADNGSTDDTPGVVERFVGHVPGLRVVSAADRRGAGHARNVGARAARGRWLLFLDADDVVAPGYVAAMATALRHRPFVGGSVDHRTLQGDWRGPVRDEWQRDRLLETTFLPATSSCAMGVWRSAFERVGGFDVELVRGQDIDLSWRLQLDGVPLTFVEDAVVHYRARPTLRAHVRQERDWGEADVALYAKYRGVGAQRRIRDIAVDTARCGRRIVAPRDRAEFVWVAGFLARHLGRVRGSIRHRAFYP